MYFAYSGGLGPPVENLANLLSKYIVIGDVAMGSTASTLSVIAIERYHAILKPFSSNLRLNEENINKPITLIWASSTALGSLGFFLHEWNNSTNYTSCDGPWGLKPNLESNIYSIICFVVTTYIPVVVFLFC